MEMQNSSGKIVGTCIWDQAEHSAFTDLIRFRDNWFCCFRESDSHVKGKDGELRILESRDGNQWTSAALIILDGWDLRDPHFSVTSDGRLMLSCAGRVIRDGEYQTLQSFSAFSEDGSQWTPLVKSGPAEHWIWRVTWVDGYAYSWVRDQNLPGVSRPQPFRLFRSADGIDWETLAEFSFGNEAVILVRPDGSLLALLRGWNSLLGESKPPYTDWTWHRTGYFTGGPNMIQLSDGRIIVGSRLFRNPHLAQKDRDPFMLLSNVDLESKKLRPALEFASHGDCGYPGLVEFENELWVSYYSDHEGKCAIYLSRVPLSALNLDISSEHLPFLQQGPLKDFSILGLDHQRLIPRHLSAIK
jgi:hypothetical protein